MSNFDRMTNEEAIKTIKVAIAEVEWNYPMDYAIAFEMAISALEKQIPKKVNVTKYDVGGNDYFCSCGNKLRDSSEYCDMCGCKLDWSDSE